MFSLIVVLCASTLVVEQISCSAIPMWESLSKQEKMSYLYSMFANQVEEFCEFSELTDCNQELLKYGLRKLKDMPEDHLDFMDPYQRGANHIIWDSMMEGHAMMKTTQKVRSTTTPKPNAYDDDLSFGFDDLGTFGAASAKIDNVYRVSPPKGFVYIRPTATYQYNIGKPEYKLPVQSQNQLPFENILKPFRANDRYDPSYRPEVPLTGPMVVKVYPDGTPVQEPISLPHDEDLRQYKLTQIRLPML